MMIFSVRRPHDATVTRTLREQSSLPFTYPGVASTKGWNAESTPPEGYRLDRVRQHLGKGFETFERAQGALRWWRPFDIGWVDVFPSDTPLQPGRVVGVRARVFGLWSLHVCRIVYAIDDDGPVARFGFGYGTVPGHAESGEERFLVEWDRETDAVTYDVLAFVRPRHPFARLAGGSAARLADRFRIDSAAAMLRAVSLDRTAAGTHL